MCLSKGYSGLKTAGAGMLAQSLNSLIEARHWIKISPGVLKSPFYHHKYWLFG